jgi:succinate dehydrogenase / fumarate reductase flavoprotein subunit
MGGVRVDPDTQMSSIPGLFAAGECASGINGANRLGGNSLSDLIVFGKRAGEYAAEYARSIGNVKVNDADVERSIKEALAPFERGAGGENPYKLQDELQDTMQSLVGIVRQESEMRQALDRIRDYKTRATRVVVSGHREYNGGWHTALDLQNLLAVAETIALSAIERKESRGGHFREDCPDKTDEFGKVNIMVKDVNGNIQVTRVPLPPIPAELQQVIEEQKQ